jgi:hypothetical protein
MTRGLVIGITVVGLGVALVAGGVRAQQPASPGSSTAPQPMGPGLMPLGAMPHPTMSHPAMPHGSLVPTLPGQDAFGAVAEIVQILDADPETDWSKVDLERLRQHLIAMNEVVLHAEVKTSAVSGGLAMDVTGAGRTEQAIRAMVIPQAGELDRTPGLTAKTALISGGVRLTVTARDPGDAKTVARVRGLGFIGLLTLGAHHQPHHLAMARGEAMSGLGH